MSWRCTKHPWLYTVERVAPVVSTAHWSQSKAHALDNERLRKSKGLAQYAFHYDAQITVIVHRRSGSACGQHLPLVPNQRPHTMSDSATMNSLDNLRNWHNLDVMDMHNIP